MKLSRLKQLLGLENGGEGKDYSKLIDLIKRDQSAKDAAAEALRQWDLEHRKVMDTAERPDKYIYKDVTITSASNFQEKAPLKPQTRKDLVRIQKVNRLPLPYQQLIVDRAVAFTFGNPVQLVCKPEGEEQESVLSIVQQIHHDNKIDSFNRSICTELYRSIHVAEYWYTVDKEHEDYGKPAKKKAKVVCFAPWKGNDLYPVFNEHEDMIAFCREFTLINDDGDSVNCFEIITDDWFFMLTNSQSSWTEIEGYPAQNTLGKIPVIYGREEKTEWQLVQMAIDRLEFLMSNYGDINDYHAAPKIFVKGTLTSMPSKGEPGGVIQGGEKSDAKYMSWDRSPEAVKLEIDFLINSIYSFTQTPDISFESIKGLREISGKALQTLFLDAHLKVQKHRLVLDAYLQRRINVLKSIIGKIFPELDKTASKLVIKPEIQPFMIDDEEALLGLLSTATGGASIMSQETAIELNPMIKDTTLEKQRIKAEETAAEERKQREFQDPFQ